MTRRTFLCGLTLGALAAPLGSGAQQPEKVWRIGYLATFGGVQPFNLRNIFVPTMRELGYVEGRNLIIEVRTANGRPERLPELAAELVRLRVDVIVTTGDSEVRAAKQATTVIPIVMSPSGDPVGAGYVASLARPGGNITGVSWMSPELSVKLLEVLREAAPNISNVAVLWNSGNPVKVRDFNETRRAAETLGLRVRSIEVKAPGDLTTAFGTITRTHPDALVALLDEVLSPWTFGRIADFAVKERLPSIIGISMYAAVGGLIGYGPTLSDIHRRAATYVDRIFRGAKPADLPVEQPTKFELVINLKTAKALGLTIPQSLLQRADQVIE
jgi:putative ABC transport system substrate-binding protein